MFNHFVEWVRRLFGKVVGQQVQSQLRDSERHKKEYEDIGHINFAAVFANTLANKAVSDCRMTVTDLGDGESRRSLFLSQTLAPVWDNIKQTVSQALGKGGKFLIPYVEGNRIFVDAVDQSTVAVNGINGAEEMTSVTVKADTHEVEGKMYQRVIDYTLSDGIVTIRTKAVTSGGVAVSLDHVPEWAGISEEITIGGVRQLPIAFLKCPRDSRKENTVYGVPITYGCEDTIRQLEDLIADYEKEFRNKKVFVGVDEQLFGKNKQLPAGGLFMTFSGASGSFGEKQQMFSVYDPPFRDASYRSRYIDLCERLEREVGTNKGTLTEPTATGTNPTATQIRAANSDTFALVSDIRKHIEKCMEELAYAVDVLAERFALTPVGFAEDYKVTFDWDMSMVESSSETFSQLSELESRGLVSGARLNSFVTGQTMQDAQAEIDAVADTKAKSADAMLTPKDFEPGGV